MSRVHDDELEIDDELVRALLAAQFPQWAELPLVRAGDGTVNVVYRLGDEYSLRLPRRTAREDVEDRVLTAVASLPVEVPRLVAVGRPGAGYPWEWAVHTWLHGDLPTMDLELDEVVGLVRGLQSLDAAAAPGPAYGRDKPLSCRDSHVRDALTRVVAPGALELWERALRAPGWHGERVWIHADLDRRNVLVRDGRLTGVLDWAGAGVGDPAVDLMVAWKLLSREDRERFWQLFDVDAATRLRAEGWCVSQALIALGYYTPETNAPLHAEATRWLAEVLAS
jgi:aminoglycoside phosphotransferase (APT) family kinase protein